MKTVIKYGVYILALSGVMMLMTGCNSISGEKIGKDGSKLSIKSTRLFWSTGKAAFSATDLDGFTTTLSFENSSADAEALKAVAEGAAAGAAKGANPIP